MPLNGEISQRVTQVLTVPVDEILKAFGLDASVHEAVAVSLVGGTMHTNILQTRSIELTIRERPIYRSESR